MEGARVRCSRARVPANVPRPCTLGFCFASRLGSVPCRERVADVIENRPLPGRRLFEVAWSAAKARQPRSRRSRRGGVHLQWALTDAAGRTEGAMTAPTGSRLQDGVGGGARTGASRGYGSGRDGARNLERTPVRAEPSQCAIPSGTQHGGRHREEHHPGGRFRGIPSDHRAPSASRRRSVAARALLASEGSAPLNGFDARPRPPSPRISAVAHAEDGVGGMPSSPRNSTSWSIARTTSSIDA